MTRPKPIQGILCQSDQHHKECQRCKIDKFAEISFDPDVGQSDGWAKVCKNCQTAEETAARNAAIARMVAQFDEAQLNLLYSFMHTHSAQHIRRVPHIMETLEAVMNMMGGAQGYAMHLMSNYISAKPGSFIRQRTLEIVGRWTQMVSEMGYVKPANQMTDEEIQKELAILGPQPQPVLGVVHHDGQYLPESAGRGTAAG